MATNLGAKFVAKFATPPSRTGVPKRIGGLQR